MNVPEFELQLVQQDRHYEACSPLPAPCVHVRFTGPFEHKIIIWDAQIATLTYYFTAAQEHTAAQSGVRPFIEIGSDSKSGRQLQIGLNVTTIDDATIRKTMIMIRQYKRLQTGRLEYGAAYCAPEVP